MYTLPKAGPSMAIHIAVLIAFVLTYPVVKLINRITGVDRLAQ